MPDEENYTKTSHIMFLKEQVLRFAAPIKHSHTYEQLRDWLGDDYVPKNHAYAGTDYGVGTENKYGHVKVDAHINEEEESTNPVQSNIIVNYVKENIKEPLSDRIEELESWVSNHGIVNEINSDNKDDEESIPTIKAVYDAILNYKNLSVDLSRPLSIDENIDLIRTPGYFQQTGIRHFSYGGETIYYANALIKVKKQSNRVIQHVYATSRVTSDGDDIYKINGCEYTRWGISENSWGAWHVAHKPYTKTTRAKIDSSCEGVDPDSVVVYENTSGFMIHWNQYKEERDTYTVTAPLYEYSDVCKFDPPLPIKGPIIFGNLIGKFDVKITSDKMQIRSNMNQGGKIVEVHEVYHVLRNQ